MKLTTDVFVNISGFCFCQNEILQSSLVLGILAYLWQCKVWHILATLPRLVSTAFHRFDLVRKTKDSMIYCLGCMYYDD